MIYLIFICLILLSALFAGLNLGFMSLGPHELKRKMGLGDKRAAKIYSVRKDGNLLLVTLLLGNVGVNSILSIYLGSLTSGVLAVLIATLTITIFGDILPQAFFSRFALDFGIYAVPVVRFFLVILYPVCKPISFVLDSLLGEELPAVYSKRELIEIISEHKKNTASDVKKDEERIARGALTFGTKRISDVMTPRSMVVAIEAHEILNDELLHKIRETGYSRIPVYDGTIDSIVGIFYVNSLLDPSVVGKEIGAVCDTKIFYVNEGECLDHVLNAFLKTRHHLFIAVNEFAETVGILGIEDVIEEILGCEIVDEFDKYDSVREVARRAAVKKLGPIVNDPEPVEA